MNETEMVAKKRREAEDKAAYFFRARRVAREKEWENNITGAPRLKECHLKNDRY